MADIVKLIGAGGDLATMALVFIAWRLDKRLSFLEWVHSMTEPGRKVDKMST